MFNYRLPNGRSVGLKRLILSDTYAGVFEGSPETASPFIRKGLRDHASQLLPPAKPLCIIDSGKGELPHWMCVAEFTSPDGVKESDSDFFSRLFICWFIDHTAMSVDDMIGMALKQVDWDRYAEDFDIMW